MWERRYRSALKNLENRFTVVVVYDAVLARAQHVAGELGAEASRGVRQIFERPDLQAVIVLDPAWYDLFPAELACEYQRPAFFAGSMGSDIEALQSLHRIAVERHVLLMAEFSRRYTPATSRLRELMVTRLGTTRQVTVRAKVPRATVSGPLPGQDCERDYLAGLLDWCQYITGRIPVQLSASPSATAGQGPSSTSWPEQVQLAFRRVSGSAIDPRAHLHLDFVDTESECGLPAEADWPFPRYEVECDHGFARITQAGEISWSNGHQPETSLEKLVAERCDAEVMLDQFARRILGGLVPVADLQDVCRALTLVSAAETGCRTGEPQNLVWNP